MPSATSTADPLAAALTTALEDYLETIYELVRDRKVARVKDIAAARQVRPASVSPAMRRLADLGLVTYTHREHIDLTPEGERLGRRIYARHQVLTRFFRQILGMSSGAADTDACAMEHALSDEAMDLLVRFIEFIEVCPNAHETLDRFRRCPVVREGAAADSACPSHDAKCTGRRHRGKQRTLADLGAGEQATVTQVHGTGAIRQRLLDMGILPGVRIVVERIAPAGGPVWIKSQGFQLSLRKKEAQAVVLDG